MASKYSDREIIAAINIVNSILEVEDFALDVGEYSTDGSGWTTELKFDVDDMQNNGRLEDKIFDNLSDVIEETNVYSSLLDSFDNRVGSETIPQDDWDRKALIFLTSDYCKELLSSITASTYSDYVKTGFGKNQDRLKENEGIDELSLLLDKDIAQKIIETQSAYVMVEYNNKVYLSYYGYSDNVHYEPIIKNGSIIGTDKTKPMALKEALLFDIKNEYSQFDNNVSNDLFTTYDNYSELIKEQLKQVDDDFYDIGLTDESGNWNFYLSKNELIYIGIDEKIIDNALKLEPARKNALEFEEGRHTEQEYDEYGKKEEQAEGLSEGWHWVHYDDASGHLESPDGKNYFSYDWNTGEYKITEDKHYDFFLEENYYVGGYSIGSFKGFKTFAENWVKENVLKNEQIKGETIMKNYDVTYKYENQNIYHSNIIQANSQEIAEQYIKDKGGIICGTVEKTNIDEDKRKGKPIITISTERAKENNSLSQPIIVANFIEKADGNTNVIMLYPNGLYYNHYGYDTKRNISNSNAGGYKTLDEAKEMMLKHRSTSIEVTIPNNNMKSVKELSRDELNELKQKYYNELHSDVSLGELANINGIVTDKEVYDYYENVSFVNDDFICNQEENIEDDFEDHDI